MIDAKSKLILKILAQECGNGNYKIVEVSDIILSLPKHYRMDSEAVRHILNYLDRQGLISIKYDDEDVFCLAVMPYGFETLEGENLKIKAPKKPSRFSNTLICFLASFFGSLLGFIICFLFFKHF